MISQLGLVNRAANGHAWVKDLEDLMRPFLTALVAPALTAFAVAGPIAISAATAQTRADPEAATGMTAKPLVTAERQMIVAAHPAAAKAGAAILARGGSAADAAIAALLVLNVVEPQSSGIGGGAFALVHGANGITSFDARETAPAGATPDLFMADGEAMGFRAAVVSGRSVGTPGLVRLFETLHQRHGKLAWAELFEPAIALARDGFPVSERLHGMLSQYGARLDGSAAGDLFRPSGAAPDIGATLRQPDLAATLEAIAEGRAAAFYSGPIADAIVAAVAADPVPGSLGTGDLAAYRVIERPAICHPNRSFRICGMGPPSSGATTVGQMLMLLDRFKPDELALDQATLWHLFAEASRLAYADRAAFLADSDFVKVPVKGLLDLDYMLSRARLINRAAASTGRATAGDPPWREGALFAPDASLGTPGTTHLSVVDADGLAISLTASIETAFGSGRMAAGFLLNNQLTDFSFRPDRDGKPIANAVAPGKRPRSSMSPTIVYDGDRPVVLTGSPGGSRIPEYVAQNLIAILHFGLDPAEAAALPHVSHRNGDAIRVDPGLAADIIEGLKSAGHEVEVREMNSGVHTIVIGPDGALSGGADPRREGVAVGE